MSKVFISYRRDDSADVTGRIYDRLIQRYVADNVFKDVDTIPLGVDFRKHITEAVSRCEVLLAVIGKQWLTVTNSVGKRRLADPDDFVRIEIEAALQRNIPVIPVLVQGTAMPSPEGLPPVLQALPFRNGIPVRPDPDFHRDMDRLIHHVDHMISAGPIPARQQMLDVEISHRIGFLPVLLEPVFTFTQLHTAKGAVTGKTDERPGIGKLGQFSPLFPEFEDKSLFALLWELRQAVPATDKGTLDGPLASAKRLPFFFDKLVMVAPRGADDSKWKMDPQFVAQYRDVLKSFALGQWNG